jgi:hypothetical protein
MGLFIVCFSIIAVLVILLAIITTIDSKRKKEYRETFIYKQTLKDSFFGDLEFEVDSGKHTLTCSGISFEPFQPKLIIEAYWDTYQELYFRSLEHLYQMREEIIQNLLNGFLGLNADESDIQKREYLKTIFTIDTIEIHKKGPYFLKDEVFLDTVCDIVEKRPIAFQMAGDPEDWVISIIPSEDKTKDSKNYRLPIAYLDCDTKAVIYTILE